MPWDMKAILTRNGEDRRKKILLLLGVLTLVAVIYSNVANCDFMFIDDSTYVTDSNFIKDLSPEGIKKIFLSFFSEELPLVHLSFAIDYQLWGFNPAPYHVENLIFHLFKLFIIFFSVFQLKLPLSNQML